MPACRLRIADFIDISKKDVRGESDAEFLRCETQLSSTKVYQNIPRGIIRCSKLIKICNIVWFVISLKKTTYLLKIKKKPWHAAHQKKICDFLCQYSREI